MKMNNHLRKFAAYTVTFACVLTAILALLGVTALIISGANLFASIFGVSKDAVLVIAICLSAIAAAAFTAQIEKEN